jgi:DNA-directed RNA polymerase specialized sigma24 family protein
MSQSGSITLCLQQLKDGDSAAAGVLWERYFQRLVLLARKRLRRDRCRAADEEDVALSAFGSFCRAAEKGRFPLLADRSDLWQILVVIVLRKAVDLIQHEQRQKRGGGKVQGESILMRSNDTNSSAAGLEQVLGKAPTPAVEAEIAEECRRLLELLPDEELRAVALWKLEGHTNEEIGGKLGCVTRSVERKLRLIRNLWKKEVAL